MKAKVQVTFDMVFDTEGECKSEARFRFPEHPEMQLPDDLRKLLVGELYILCAAMKAAQL
jgi:hypothetical protein